ncbi:MAG: ArsR family transcriptional regulator [Bacillota bacterium]
MLDSLITSKTRIQLLLRFFLNPDRVSYLRELSDELGESTNGIRVELNRLADAKLLIAEQKGRVKRYQANINHPLFPEINSLVRKTLGLDRLVEDVVKKLGDIQLAILTGDYARGIDSGIIDIIIVGETDTIDASYLQVLVNKVEGLIARKIRVLLLRMEEYEKLSITLYSKGILVIWNGTENKK